MAEDLVELVSLSVILCHSYLMRICTGDGLMEKLDILCSPTEDGNEGASACLLMLSPIACMDRTRICSHRPGLIP